jgi:hypothetical protein
MQWVVLVLLTSLPLGDRFTPGSQLPLAGATIGAAARRNPQIPTAPGERLRELRKRIVNFFGSSD